MASANILASIGHSHAELFEALLNNPSRKFNMSIREKTETCLLADFLDGSFDATRIA